MVPAFVRSDADRRALLRCLDALRQAVPAADEIVVVDDGSPLPVTLRHDASARVVRQPNQGPAAARNRGAAETTGDVIVFIDADIEVPPSALGLLAAAVDAPGVAAAWGTVTAAHPHPGLVSRYKNLSHLHFTTCLEHETRHLTTMAAAVRREAFTRVGGFDERYDCVSVEDVELGRDLHDAGYRVLLERRVACVHWHRFTLAGAVANDFRKLRALVAATLWRRTAGRPSTAARDGATRRQSAYARGAVIGAAAIGAALWGRPKTALLLGAAMVALEWRFWRFLAAHEGVAFALACVPLMAIERANALLAGATALLASVTGRAATPRRHRRGAP